MTTPLISQFLAAVGEKMLLKDERIVELESELATLRTSTMSACENYAKRLWQVEGENAKLRAAHSALRRWVSHELTLLDSEIDDKIAEVQGRDSENS